MRESRNQCSFPDDAQPMEQLLTDDVPAGTPYLASFLRRPIREQMYELRGFAWDREAHGAFVNSALSTLNRYAYGRPTEKRGRRRCGGCAVLVQRTKLLLEQELIDHWLPTQTSQRFPDQYVASEYLMRLLRGNRKVENALARCITNGSGLEEVIQFLRCDALHRDEADRALIEMAAKPHALLCDERMGVLFERCVACRMRQSEWLRYCLGNLEHRGGGSRNERLKPPWRSELMSNALMTTLTHPGLEVAAYGFVIMSEAIVCTQLQKVLTWAKRPSHTLPGDYADLDAPPEDYFVEQLMALLGLVAANMSLHAVEQIVLGAEWAVSAATQQHDDSVNKCSDMREKWHEWRSCDGASVY